MWVWIDGAIFGGIIIYLGDDVEVGPLRRRCDLNHLVEPREQVLDTSVTAATKTKSSKPQKRPWKMTQRAGGDLDQYGGKHEGSEIIFVRQRCCIDDLKCVLEELAPRCWQHECGGITPVDGVRGRIYHTAVA